MNPGIKGFPVNPGLAGMASANGTYQRLEPLPKSSGMTWALPGRDGTVVLGLGQHYNYYNDSSSLSYYWEMTLYSRMLDGHLARLGALSFVYEGSVPLLAPDGCVYVLAGNGYNQVQPTFYRFRPSLGREDLAAAPSVIVPASGAVGEVAGCVLPDGRLMFSKCDGTTYVYDPSAQTWTALASAPAADSSMSLYVQSTGMVLRWSRGAAQWVEYNPATNVWSTLALVSGDAFAGGISVAGALMPSGQIYFPQRDSAFAAVFDRGANRWSQVPGGDTAGAAVALQDGTVLIAGGQLPGVHRVDRSSSVQELYRPEGV